MTDLFLTVLNTSLTACWLVLAVIVLRLLLKKAPKWLMGILWAFVGLRLVLPFSIESVFSLIPSRQPLPPETLTATTPAIDSGIPAVDAVVNPLIGGAFTDGPTLSGNPADSVTPLQIIAFVAAVLWLAGIAVMAVYALISTWRLKRRVAEAVPGEGGVWLCDAIETPFVLGVVKPRIYLPATLGETDTAYVLAHERAHLRRRDHWWKPMGYLLLTVHWFNPLLWLGYSLLCRDIELACDEKVIRELGTEQKQPYSTALVNCSVPRRMLSACPLAFGEVGVKARVKSVLNYKKPAFWLVIVAVVALIATALCLLTDPKTYHPEDLNDELKVFLDTSIAEHHRSEEHPNDHFVAVDYEILRIEDTPAKTKVYAWILYQEYSYTDGQLQAECGSHCPTVITGKKAGKSAMLYELEEYWTPRDGADYIPDIHDKFPRNLWSKATDSQQYIQQQKQACETMAREYYEATGSSYQAVLAQNNKKIGVIHVNSHTDYASYERNYSTNFYGALLPLIPEQRYVEATDGKTLYALLPGADVVSVKVYGWIGDEATKTAKGDQLLYTGGNEPLLVRSDYEHIPKQARVVVTTREGESITFMPHISMKDGSVIVGQEAADQVLDMTLFTIGNMSTDKHPLWSSSSDQPGLIMYAHCWDKTAVKLRILHTGVEKEKVAYFTTGEAYEICAIHNGRIISFGDYMRDVLGKEYEEREIFWHLLQYQGTPDKEIQIETALRMFDETGGLPTGEYILYKPVTVHYTDGREETRYCAARINSEPYIHDYWTNVSTVIDQTTFDIDRDGKEELCTLAYGPTSGMFTVDVVITEAGKEEYRGFYYVSLHADLRFSKENGKLWVTGTEAYGDHYEKNRQRQFEFTLDGDKPIFINTDPEDTATHFDYSEKAWGNG